MHCIYHNRMHPLVDDLGEGATLLWINSIKIQNRSGLLLSSILMTLFALDVKVA